MRVVFAGSFDPPTNGHMDIILRASSVFESVHVVLAKNIYKESFLALDVRQSLLEELVRHSGLSNVVVVSWDGLIADYVSKNSCQALLRSVRSMYEVPAEQRMAQMNGRLEESLETVFMFSKPELSDISSTAVRELVSWKRLPKNIVPESVRKELEKRYGPLSQ
jgi:pantetheine-phosphate adenylyltransferase